MSAGGGGSGGGGVSVTASFLGGDDVLNQMNVIGRAAEAFGSKLTSKLGQMFGAAALGAAAFQKLSASIEKNVATAKQVSALSVKFNMDPKEVHSVKLAADDAGVSIRALLSSTKVLAKSAKEGLGMKNMRENFAQLGIDAGKLAEIQARPLKSFPMIAVALSKIADENERAAAGAMLLGRQYQQVQPLLESLAGDEQKRIEFLDNQNAMTAEQIRLNKEVASASSKMNESWDKLAAAGAPILSWVANFTTMLLNSARAMANIVADSEKLKNAKDKQEAGTSVLKAESWQDKLKARIAATQKKKLSIIAGVGTKESTGLTDEEEKEYDEVYAAGGIANYMVQQMQAARQLSIQNNAFKDRVEFAARSGSEYGGFVMPTAAENKREEELLAKINPELRKQMGPYGLGNMEQDRFDEMMIDLEAQAAEERVGQGLMPTYTGTDEEGNFITTGRVMSAHGVAQLAVGQDEEAAIYSGQAATALAAKQAAARVMGRVYDAKTDKDYTEEEFAALQKKRNKDKLEGAGALTFEDTREKEKRDKERKAATLALEKSERHLNEPYMSPLEKAEAAAEDAAGDLVPLQGEVAEVQGKIDYNKTSTAEAEAKLKPLLEKEKKLKDAADAEIARKKEARAKILARKEEDLAKTGGKLTEAQKAKYNLSKEDEEKIRAKYHLSVEELENMNAQKGVIAGNAKELEKLNNEQMAAQTKLNQGQQVANQANDALIKARDEAYQKEKKQQDDLQKDALDYEKEKQDLKYKNMKLNGDSELRILEEKFTDEMLAYRDAAKEKEDLEAELQRHMEERAEITGKYEYTDQEKEQLKAAREKKDAKRKSTEAALYAMADEKGSAAVVSDLGKLGGGRAVQFGNNNPVELIRKSNYWLEIIAKEVSSDKLNTNMGGVYGIMAPTTPSKAP